MRFETKHELGSLTLTRLSKLMTPNFNQLMPKLGLMNLVHVSASTSLPCPNGWLSLFDSSKTKVAVWRGLALVWWALWGHIETSLFRQLLYIFSSLCSGSVQKTTTSVKKRPPPPAANSKTCPPRRPTPRIPETTPKTVKKKKSPIRSRPWEFLPMRKAEKKPKKKRKKNENNLNRS